MYKVNVSIVLSWALLNQMECEMLLSRLDDKISVVLIVILSCITFIQVLFRFVFNLPLDWSEEVSRFSYIILVYLSASIAVRDNSMIKIELLELLIGEKIKAVRDRCVELICAGFSFFISYQTIYMIKNAFVVDQLSPALEIPMSFMYGIELLMFFLIGVRYVQRFINALRKKELEVEK